MTKLLSMTEKMSSRKRNISNVDFDPPPLRRKLADRAELSSDTQPAPGSSLSNSPAKHKMIRIFAWNVNGIQPLITRPISSFFQAEGSPTQDKALAPLKSFLKRHNWPHILCLQEVKISPSDRATTRSIQTAIGGLEEPPETAYTAHFCLPSDKHNAKGFGGKVYGVATLIRNDYIADSVSKVKEVNWDLEGRVLITEAISKLAVINVYAVNGTENPYQDPITGHITGTRHDRKLAFHEYLLKTCQQYEANGWRVVLAGDMNISRTRLDSHPYLRNNPRHVKNRKDFNDKFFDDAGGLRAIDSFRVLHGDAPRYTYHPPGRPWGSGCDRVDLIVISRSLRENLIEADILDSRQERGHSDHVPLYISLKDPLTEG